MAVSFFGFEQSILTADKVGLQHSDFGVGKGIALTLPQVESVLTHTFLLNSQNMSEVGLEVDVILRNTLMVLFVSSD